MPSERSAGFLEQFKPFQAVKQFQPLPFEPGASRRHGIRVPSVFSCSVESAPFVA